MSAGAIIMFLFGAVLLWGGFGVTVSIALKNREKKEA